MSLNFKQWNVLNSNVKLNIVFGGYSYIESSLKDWIQFIIICIQPFFK